MSHDRGCFKCGRDPWEYDDCPKEDCVKRGKTVDFGFTTFDGDAINAELQSLRDVTLSKDGEVEQLKEGVNRNAKYIDEIVELVMPLLERLRDTADQPHIHWPNRRGIMEDLISRIQSIRGKSTNA